MPIFTINLKKVKDNYERLKKELPDALIAYALKANYDTKILKALASLGCSAEVCSEYEHAMALRAGFKKIIRNGFSPSGKAWLTNVEDLSDIPKIKGLIGARLSLDPKSKLGLPEGEILTRKWDCISIHTREDFTNALLKAEEIANKVSAKYVDAGGGFSIDRLDVLKKIRHALIIEPGRYLVSNACELICKVLAVKNDKIIIDAGMNLLNKFADNKYNVRAEKQGTRNHAYKIYGPIPTDIDSIGTHNLPLLEKGDTLVIENAGAYTLSMFSKWILPKPRIKYV